MLVNNYSTVRPEMGRTRTYEDFGKFLGQRGHKLGLVARLYPENTISALTDMLGNIWMGGDKHKAGGFKSIDSDYIEWDIETNQLKKLKFVAEPEGDGADGSEIKFFFGENYYQLEEIFKIDVTGQQIFVVCPPVRRADNLWEVTGRLIDNDYRSILDTTGTYVGATTHWIGNAKPEMSDCGFTKYQSNVETMRNFMTTIRVDESWSDKYKLMEDTLIKIGAGSDKGTEQKTYVMEPMMKVLLDNFMQAQEQMLLMAKGNVDVNGKATIATRNSQRPIVIGEGIIPQIERFCSKHVASKITINTLHTVMQEMIQKCEKDEGNHFIFVCNAPMMNIVNKVFMEFLKDFKTDGALFYSKMNGGSRYKVGASFSSYEYNGNIISFKQDRTLTREYPMPFAMCLDFTGSTNGNIPPIQKFSLKGKDLMISKMHGPGYGESVVSTMVAGGAMTAIGHVGIAVMNPYKSYLLYSTEKAY